MVSLKKKQTKKTSRLLAASRVPETCGPPVQSPTEGALSASSPIAPQLVSPVTWSPDDVPKIGHQPCEGDEEPTGQAVLTVIIHVTADSQETMSQIRHVWVAGAVRASLLWNETTKHFDIWACVTQVSSTMLQLEVPAQRHGWFTGGSDKTMSPSW